MFTRSLILYINSTFPPPEFRQHLYIFLGVIEVYKKEESPFISCCMIAYSLKIQYKHHYFVFFQKKLIKALSNFTFVSLDNTC